MMTMPAAARLAVTLTGVLPLDSTMPTPTVEPGPVNTLQARLMEVTVGEVLIKLPVTLMVTFTWTVPPGPVGVNVTGNGVPEVTPAQPAGAAKVKVVAAFDAVTLCVALGVITRPVRPEDAVTLLEVLPLDSAMPMPAVVETPVPALQVRVMALAVGLPG